MDLNYEFHQRQSAVSFRAFLAPPRTSLFLPRVYYIPIQSERERGEGQDTVSARRVKRERERDEKFWRRHKNAARSLHFPFKITSFAPFSVYYYQVVQQPPLSLCPALFFFFPSANRSRYSLLFFQSHLRTRASAFVSAILVPSRARSLFFFYLFNLFLRFSYLSLSHTSSFVILLFFSSLHLTFLFRKTLSLARINTPASVTFRKIHRHKSQQRISSFIYIQHI